MSRQINDIFIDKIVNYWSVEKVETFLMEGTQHFTFDVNTQGSKGLPALALFVLSKEQLSERDKRIMTLLLEHGADPLFTCDALMGHTLICMLAIFHDSEIIIQFLRYVKNINCYVRVWDKMTPLHFATIQDDETLVRYVLTRNPHLEMQNERGYTALHLVSVNTNGLAIARSLLEYNQDLDVPDNRGYTPLIRAVLRKKYDLVKLLIDKGANLQSRDDHGNTAMLLAISRKYFSMVTLLLENGANLMDTNYHGFNALHTFFINHFELDSGLFKFLISRCDINAIDAFNKTPLQFYLETTNYGSYKIIKNFIKNGANLNMQDIEGDSALHVCAQNPSVPVGLMLHLIEGGADPSLRNNQNDTFFDILLTVERRRAIDFIKYSVVQEAAVNLSIGMEIQNRINVDRELLDFQKACRKEIYILKSYKILPSQS